ncbi:class I SAM-dependent methyltransferase [Paenibacillus motobuensis]|uniref:class I SAM-dependent methyltransferase n=1 Tax=Paenibacillus TaxID=44249 RepID=UPI00203F74DF|nr:MULTISPECIES: class I SAM-dependent methyltransferase [Paenibacillus]MCM3042993.1 class I SAM-dependent methyltransferase [Paenibacillus lutimineralis]MCM3650097.1 class I SAM-dependent methyltransferase [Paenibacillus motobuensis]
MSDHYYTSRPTTAHDRRNWEAELHGYKLRFVSDAGVFAKGGVDYGSRTLVEAMEIPVSAEVLDVGCGYGPIGLTAAKLASQGHVTMIDVNGRAVELARENARNNKVDNVTILESDLFAALDSTAQFDVVLTNPPIRAGKEVVHAIFEGAYERLRSGGALWIVIQKKQGAPSAKQKLESLFTQVEEVTKDKGYRIYRAIK